PQGVVVPVESDVSHPRRRDELCDPLHHAEPRPEDRHQRQLLPRDLASAHPLERSLDLHWLGRQVLGGLVRHQHGDLAHELLEVARAGLPIAEDRELVLDERMVEDGEVGKRRGHGGQYAGGRRLVGLWWAVCAWDAAVGRWEIVPGIKAPRHSSTARLRQFCWSSRHTLTRRDLPEAGGSALTRGFDAGNDLRPPTSRIPPA